MSERITEKRPPSVLGIYDENPGPEELVATVCGDSLSVYVQVPTHLRNRLEVVVGSQFVGKLLWIMKKNGEMIDIAAGGVFEVKGYWNEMHLPDFMVQLFGIKRGDSLKFILRQIINYSEAMDVYGRLTIIFSTREISFFFLTLHKKKR